MRNRRSGFGLLFALLALAMQLRFGAAIPGQGVPAALEAAATICHTGAPPDQAPSHPGDCLVCPLCVSRAASVFVPQSSPSVPAPRVVAIARAAVPPPSTAPPGAVNHAERSRGPPETLT